MKKVAFYITSSGWGGLEMNTIKLANSLVKRGWHVTLISCEESTLFKEGKDAFTAVTLITYPKKYLDIRNAYKIHRALKSGNINTVFIFINRDINVIFLTKKLFKPSLNIIYQQHMQIGLNKKDFVHTLRYRSLNAWISPLNFLKDEVGKKTRFPGEKVKIIPLGVDTKRFITPKYTKDEALKKLGLSPVHPLIGVIGRISENKGQQFLVDAIRNLRDQGILVELLIFGSPTINDKPSRKYYCELKRGVKENDLKQIVHFIDFNEEVELFYNSIDIFALPSHRETYGMVTLEAMLSGLPVIATNSGGTPEILEQGNLGQLFEFDDLDEFCDKVKWVLENKDKAMETARKAQKTAMEKYSLENEISQIEELISNPK